MRQALTPEEIHSTTFSTALRGYDRQEVDDFLQAVGDSMQVAVREASERAYQNLGEEMGNLLQHAKDSADDLIRRAEEEAAGVREDARLEAARMRQEAESDAARDRRDAERDATEARAAAEKDAAERIREAEQRVAELRQAEDEVRRRVAELRTELSGVGDHLHRLETSGRAAGSPEPVDATAESDVQSAPDDDAIRLDRTEQPAR